MPGVESEVVEWPANRVRETFIKFFEEKNHVDWRSSPVVPVNDPTLLFANAGAVLISLSASVWFLRKRRKMWKLDCF
jgi:alanyl-tRNA synthetase